MNAFFAVNVEVLDVKKLDDILRGVNFANPILGINMDSNILASMNFKNNTYAMYDDENNVKEALKKRLKSKLFEMPIPLPDGVFGLVFINGTPTNELIDECYRIISIYGKLIIICNENIKPKGFREVTRFKHEGKIYIQVMKESDNLWS